MSLLTDNMVSCHLADKSTSNDGYGGFVTTYTEGAQFDAAIVYNTSLEAKVAERQGVKDLYTVTVRRKNMLDYHEVFTRDSDGRIFRVTSDGLDNKTPISAGLDMRQVSAEEYVLPNGAEIIKPDGQNTGVI